jgi:hypothetical protein
MGSGLCSLIQRNAGFCKTIPNCAGFRHSLFFSYVRKCQTCFFEEHFCHNSKKWILKQKGGKGWKSEGFDNPFSFPKKFEAGILSLTIRKVTMSPRQ